MPVAAAAAEPRPFIPSDMTDGLFCWIRNNVEPRFLTNGFDYDSIFKDLTFKQADWFVGMMRETEAGRTLPASMYSTDFDTATRVLAIDFTDAFSQEFGKFEIGPIGVDTYGVRIEQRDSVRWPDTALTEEQLDSVHKKEWGRFLSTLQGNICRKIDIVLTNEDPHVPFARKTMLRVIAADNGRAQTNIGDSIFLNSMLVSSCSPMFGVCELSRKGLSRVTNRAFKLHIDLSQEREEPPSAAPSAKKQKKMRE